MRMTVTMESLTTDAAVSFLSAMEAVGLLAQVNITTQREEGEDPSQIETTAPSLPSTLVSQPLPGIVPEDAADCDLFIADVFGFPLQDALDTWVQGSRLYPGGAALPPLGAVTLENLVRVPDAQRLIGRPPTALYNGMNRGDISYVAHHHTRYLTREQVAVLALAETLRLALGYQRLTARVLRAATGAFLATFPSSQQVTSVA